jgi:NAD(P)H-hydrate repair Nnr-like enzyme with NAD(P)H-hydrate dehydratase domain
MKPEFWQRQEPDQPLYGDLLWSRPENRQLAGKLLIIGGSEHGFAAPAEAFNLATKAGAGTVRVALPDALRKTVGLVFEAGEYVPSTPSGSFAQTALAELLSMALWADGVLLAGDLGRNSETAILIEAFMRKYRGQLTVTGDAVDYLQQLPELLDRPDTLLVPTFAQLQKLFIAGSSAVPLTSQLDLMRVVEAVHAFSAAKQSYILLGHERTVFAAVNGQVSTTRFSVYDMPAAATLAARAAIWWLQNPSKPLPALTTAAVA